MLIVPPVRPSSASRRAIEEGPRRLHASARRARPPARSPPPRRRPVAATVRAWAGVEIPKPTATGSDVAPRAPARSTPPDPRPATRSRRSRRVARPDTRTPAPRRPRRRRRSGRVVGAISRIRSSGLACTADSTRRIASRRQVGEQQPGDPERVGVAQEAVEAVAEDRIEVAEDHHRTA